MINYKGQQLDVRSGDVILFRSGFIWFNPLTWVSAAVRFFTRCYYNHCAIVVTDWQTPFISESNEKGIVTRPMQQYLERKKTKIIVLRPLFEINEAEFCKRANSMLGTKYGFTDLLFFQLFYRLTGVWIGRTEGEAIKNGMVCSEFVAWCLQFTNWWLFSSKELLRSEMLQVVYKEQ